MKVVFLEQVEGTAYPGDVKVVADGFARNFLLPRGLAVPATKPALERAEALSRREEKRQAKLDEGASGVRARLEGIVLSFEERVGEQGRLYGSVTVSNIAERLSETLREDFDRHKVLLSEPLRTLGRHDVRLRLSRNVDYMLPVDVIGIGIAPEDQPVQEAVAATESAPVAVAPEPAPDETVTAEDEAPD